jgi:redox-sensitive bicupin YhaK (pirin superfamily)
MFQIRKSSDRGYADHGWLKSMHTFSFANYYDPAHMSFASLRVINEDFIAGGGGFPTHPHQDMEIITYVTEGILEHKDSMGNSTQIKPGEVQRMSAGTGIRHSEFNSSPSVSVHLLQIWILPEEKGITPSYGQKSFLTQISNEKFVLVASRDGREDSVSLNQDADLYVGKSESRQTKEFAIRPHRNIWIQLISGELKVNDHILNKGDAIAITHEKSISLDWQNAEFILFDLQDK